MNSMWPLIQIHLHAVTAETATDSYMEATYVYKDYKWRAHAAWHTGLGMQDAVSFIVVWRD